MLRRPVLALLAVALVVASCSSDDSGGGEVATETNAPTTTEPAGPLVDVGIQGPITGGERDLPYSAMPAGFEKEHGYREEEYFVTGEATAFSSPEPLATDGGWSLEAGATAPYTTRMIVRQPKDTADFNGVVVVEWFNVTAGRDSDPDFGFLYPELLAKGYAYIGVSAQLVGVEGGSGLEVPGVPAEALVALKEWDPTRYEPLEHPGDEFSYDIFTQVGAIAEGRAEDGPLDDLDVTTVLGLGESQSASRLVSYIDGVHSIAETYDGFLVHSRGGSGAPLGAGPNDGPPEGVRIRADLEEPVLIFETETDFSFLGFRPARQPDTDRIATWEVAGTAHADQATLDYGIEAGSRWSDAGATLDLTETCGAANDGPQPEVLRAALERLRAWAEEGTQPTTAAPLDAAPDGTIARDADGNAIGGIRTPAVDAPTTSLTGVGNDVSVFCSLFGQVTPLSESRLAELYPTHEDYVDAVTTSADDALAQGFLLEVDRDALVAQAEESDIGG